MLKKLNHFLLALVFGFIIIQGYAYSDMRYYLWTYQYDLTKPKTWEIEYYNTMSTTNESQFKGNTTSEHEIEFEVGMTDFFDFTLENDFEQPPGGSLQYDSYSLRFRFKLADKNSWFIDPLLYVEYEGKPDFSGNVLEDRLILSKDFGDFNFSVNPAIEYTHDNGKWVFTSANYIGAKYSLKDLLRLCIDAHGDKNGNYIGPVISHGIENLWVTFGPAFKIGNVSKDYPEMMIRLIVGFGNGKNKTDSD